MSKKTFSRRKAFFTLEPDGFSIHTIELSRQVTSNEYYSMKDELYCQQKDSPAKGWMYPDDYGNHFCKLYKENGIRYIRLEHNESDRMDTYFVRMVVNPRKLIAPESSYIGILPPEKSSIKRLRKAFARLFEDTVFENDINAYQLTRVDLCTNIHCDNKKLFRELVRVLRKLPTPPKYERKQFKSKDRKATNRYNKHYIRFCCGTHELVIYDKTYQMQEFGVVVSYEKLPESVLRFEVHCERAYIREFEKKFGCTETEDVLWRLIQKSEPLIIKHFSRCFSDAHFVQIDELKRLIEASTYKKKNKAVMLELTSQLQRMQSVDKAVAKLDKAGYDTAELLERFDKLGISPIPLRKKFCAKELPGPVELLRAVSNGDLLVEYLRVKYK